MNGILIVGAGECGVRAAFALREGGYEGRVRLVGDEPHLPYERPPLSKDFPVAAKPIAPEETFVEAGVELLRGRRAEEVDEAAKCVRLEDGSRLAYDTLLLATGARPRLFPGIESAKTLRTVDDATAILGALTPDTHIAIIGGGFIGLELAATARRIGAKVTVVEAADRLMARAVPTEIAAIAESRHRAEGVEFILNAQVRTATENSITLSDGRVVDCDLVVAGVGAVPNTELAESAGLALDNGIVVDGEFRTSAPTVYAAGDCCAFPYRGRTVRLESWRAAQDHGNYAVCAMLGGADAAYAKTPWFWSDQYDLCLQVTGLAEAGCSSVRRDISDGTFILFHIDANGGLVSASGIGAGNAIAKDIRLAEMMIERGIAPDTARLADPAVSLKALLKG
jgi:3-phenylpropionate/trans-cinnamate dioxygenase ferredoxin reductase component